MSDPRYRDPPLLPYSSSALSHMAANISNISARIPYVKAEDLGKYQKALEEDHVPQSRSHREEQHLPNAPALYPMLEQIQDFERGVPIQSMAPVPHPEETDQDAISYPDYCRLYYANIVLTNQVDYIKLLF